MWIRTPLILLMVVVLPLVWLLVKIVTSRHPKLHRFRSISGLLNMPFRYVQVVIVDHLYNGWIYL